MRVKTFIVNLKDSVLRRKHMLTETSKFPFMDIEFIEAIDGRCMSEKDIHLRFDVKKFIKDYQRLPAKGEIGCTLSHRRCYERLLFSNEPYVLILEDDVSFPFPEEVEYIIGEGTQLLQEGRTDLVLFIPDMLYYNFPRKINEKYAVYPVQNAYSTYAYLINRKGAECLLKNKYPHMVADDFLFMRQIGVRIQCIYPSIALSSNLESIIDEEREKQRMALRKRSFFDSLAMYFNSMYIKFLLKCGILVGRGGFS